MVGDGAVHDGPDDGVQAGAVAAGREDTNAHSPKNLLHVSRDRTTLSGSIPATLPAAGGGAAPCVRQLDVPAHLCGPAVRRAGDARGTARCTGRRAGSAESFRVRSERGPRRAAARP
ncbi:hypothetical protein GCM10010448_09460 [Streptomyces glomeratus]|uniref:Uncharacterized protein n=1 Tax=Streptomyces glomeratus TaxID=284452 RepID=A0ABP6L3L0_9ACTN